MADQDIATAWKSFDPERRTALLAKMSPDQKKKLRSLLEGQPAPLPNVGLAPPAGAPPPKGTLPTEGFTTRTAPGQILERVGENMESMSELPTQFLRESRERFKTAREKGDYEGMALAIPQAEASALAGAGKGLLSMTAPGIANRLRKKESPANIIGDAAMMVGLVPEGEAVSPGAFKRALAPREIPLAGERVPVLVGEAAPETRIGRLQTEVKRAGGGEQSFKDFAAKQQAAVKQVIRNVAQQTSGMVGPMQSEPAAAMADAASATFDKARPMYQALDDALVTVPDAMENVSAVTKQALARAKKLGVEITEGGGESVVINGRKFTPETDPEGWRNLQEQGLVPKTSGQPLATYMKVRSALLDMKRGATDAAQRYAIGQEVEWMNTNIEAALKDTPLWDTWNEANRLWAKGYAVRDVADAIRQTTEGTPASSQAPGLSKVPTQIKGPQLVKRLNDLAQERVLEKAFTPEETANLRQAADILDRAEMPAGREFGFGYSPRSTWWRNVVKLPAYPLVKAMTTIDGVNALKALDAAKTPAEAQAATAKFVGLMGAGQVVGNRQEALTALGR